MGPLSYNAVSTGIILLKNWQCPQKAQLLAYNFLLSFFWQPLEEISLPFPDWRPFVFIQQSTSSVSDRFLHSASLGHPSINDREFK